MLEIAHTGSTNTTRRWMMIFIAAALESIDLINSYTEGYQRDDFLADRKTQDAVIRNFEIIGEAVKRLSEETRQTMPGIPWRQFAGFRDVLIHQYDGINLSEVWLTVENDLPVLKKAVDTLLESDNIR